MEQTSQQQGGLHAIQDKGGLSTLEHLSPLQIIEKDIEKFKLDLDPYKAYAALLKMTQQPNFRLVRANDTLVLVDNHNDGTGDAMVFTADKPQAFVKTLKHLNKAFRIGGFHEMTFTSTGIAIEPLMKKAGLKYKASDIKVKSGDKVLNGKRITVFE